jgi:ASC-1-like (ASCH) protein
MAVICKKIWPKYFRMIKAGKKNCELRLADFRIKPGDWLVWKNGAQKRKYGCYLIEL